MDEDEFCNAEVRQLLQNAERRLRERDMAKSLSKPQTPANEQIVGEPPTRHNLTLDTMAYQFYVNSF